LATRGRQFTRREPQRRKLVWADLQISMAAATAVAEHDLLQTYRAATGASSVGITIMGVILQHSAGKSGGTGLLGNAVRVGIKIGNLTADTYSPVSQPHVDWMWNKRYYVGDLGLSFAYESDHQERIKSRRKCEEVQDTCIMYVEPELAGATGLNYSAHVRTLLALP